MRQSIGELSEPIKGPKTQKKRERKKERGKEKAEVNQANKLKLKDEQRLVK